MDLVFLAKFQNSWTIKDRKVVDPSNVSASKAFFIKTHSQAWNSFWQLKPFKDDEKWFLFHLKNFLFSRYFSFGLDYSRPFLYCNFIGKTSLTKFNWSRALWKILMLTEQLHVRLNYLTQECLKKCFYHRKRFLMNPSRTLSPSPTPNPTPSMANGASFHRFSGNLTNNCRNNTFFFT